MYSRIRLYWDKSKSERDIFTYVNLCKYERLPGRRRVRLRVRVYWLFTERSTVQLVIEMENTIWFDR